MLRFLRKIVKSVIPYRIESHYISQRYGKAGYVDFIGEKFESSILRFLVGMMPYGLVKAVLERRYCCLDWTSHQRDFARITECIRVRVARGKPVRVMFLVSDMAMFAAEPLFVQMMKDAFFQVQVAAIPDFRRLSEVESLRRTCEAQLVQKYPQASVVRICPDAVGNWPDLLSSIDIVCYPTPYDYSDFRYCIKYSSGRDVLPIMVNYGYYRSIYDRKIMASENYAHLWKAFFECPYTMAEFRNYALTQGKNAVLSGYVKMDALQAIVPKPHSRKRILIALHHSIPGSKNDDLALATVLSQATFLASLPDIYPELDFIIRPHPYLLQALEQNSAWGKARVDAFVQHFKEKMNVIWLAGGEYFTAFAESDGCIQDCGSYLVEYMYTGKPCCYMLHNPKDITQKFAPLGQKCLSACYIAYSERAIIDFLDKVIIQGMDEKQSIRSSLQKEIMIGYPEASILAIKNIRDALLGKDDK